MRIADWTLEMDIFNVHIDVGVHRKPTLRTGRKLIFNGF